MKSAMITRSDFEALVKIVTAFVANERPVDLVVVAAQLLTKLRPQA